MTNVRPLADSEEPSDQSLARLLGSKAVTARCPTCVAEAGPLAPQLRNGKVVGYVLVVDGRAQVIEVFASNAMMQAHLPAALRSTGLLVAALALRADDVGLKPDTNETPEYIAGKAKKAAEDTLKSLKRFADTADIIELRIVEKLPLALLRIDSRSTQGSALMLEHRLLHAVLYPHDPYRGALFDEPLDNTKGAGSGSADASRGELERRAARGTLTPAERRRIERINPGTPATPEVR